MDNSKQNKDSMKNPLAFHPLKDIICYVSGIICILAIFLATFLAKPKGNSFHVEIRYQNTLLYEVNDKSQNTNIEFPSEGEKRITFSKEDGKRFGFKDGFDFLGNSITLTLYSDKSIQIKKDDVTCIDHTCSGLGRVYNSYTPIVCLKNHFQAMIVGDGFPETVN